MNPKWERSAVDFPYPVIHFYLREHREPGLRRMRNERRNWGALQGSRNFSSRLAVVFPFSRWGFFYLYEVRRHHSRMHFSEARRAETHHPSSCASLTRDLSGLLRRKQDLAKGSFAHRTLSKVQRNYFRSLARSSTGFTYDGTFIARKFTSLTYHG